MYFNAIQFDYDSQFQTKCFTKNDFLVIKALLLTTYLYNVK